MSIQIKFGTDGWRGRIADDYTFDTVRRCTQGFAAYMLEQGYKDEWIVVGHDRRFQSENFAVAVAEVLAGNGMRVYLTDGPTPTPAIAYAIVNKQAVGGINITASHNPATDNGFKVRNQYGGAIDPAGLKAIESLIPEDSNKISRDNLQDAIQSGTVKMFDPAPAYINQIKSLVKLDDIKKAGLKILIDPMWGNGAGWFTKLLSGGKTTITEIHYDRNPIFPEMSRPEPIPPNVNVGLMKVVEQGADVLIITDGDADRLGLGDEKGQFIDQLRVFGLLAYYLLEMRAIRGPIVKTLSTTNMLNKLGKLYHIPVYDTGVGFKYVAPKMLETHAMIGGEESGGYAFHGHVPERDGILAGLYILDMLVRSGLKSSQLLDLLFAKVGAHYYDRIDLLLEGDRAGREAAIRNSNPRMIGGLGVTGLDTTDGYKFSMEDGGWLLIRFSGTEPVIRIYTETTHKDRVQDILADGVRILKG